MNAPSGSPVQYAPQQQRSHATRRRILIAVNRLLLHQSFDSLTVQQIATAANCSIGAFYGRFSGKDDLLAPLLHRHNRGIHRWLRRALADPVWNALPLDERLRWIVRADVHILRSRRWLIRALAVYVRQSPRDLPEEEIRRRTDFTISVRELLLDQSRFISHGNAADAIDFALFLIATLCRERVLFGELSERAWIATEDESLVNEISNAAYAYLTQAR